MTSSTYTPEPPLRAVIFTFVRSDGDSGYSETAKQMLALAAQQPDFIGYESTQQELGISVSY